MSNYSAGFALADQLIDEAAGRIGVTLTAPRLSISLAVRSLTLHTAVDDAGCLSLGSLGLDADGYLASQGRVCAIHKGERTDRDGYAWEITIIHEVGPLAQYAHLLTDGQAGEVAA